MKCSRPTGFTLIELTVVLVIAGLLFAITLPNLSAMSESMAYRTAVRDVMSAAQTARRQSTRTGEAVDLLIDPREKSIALRSAQQAFDDAEVKALGGVVEMAVTSAAEVSPAPGLAGIRFYPFGGSTGGDIEIMGPGGAGTLIQVGWLMGDVRQSAMP